LAADDGNIIGEFIISMLSEDESVHSSDEDSDSSSDEFVDISPLSKSQKNTCESQRVDSRPSCSYVNNIRNGGGNNVENDSDNYGNEEDAH
jgi:hypothetical protein